MKKIAAINLIALCLAFIGLTAVGNTAVAEDQPFDHLKVKLERACQRAVDRGLMRPVERIDRETLVQLVNAPSRSVQTCAIYVLGEVGEESAIEPLVIKLADPDAHLRRAAARALGKIGNSLAVSALIDRMNDPEEKLQVRKSAARALGRMQDPRAAQALRQAAQGGHDQVSAVAANSLERMQEHQLWSAR